MKRLFILSGILAVLVTGCEVHPYADFTANYTKVQPDEDVIFTNYSERAVSYEWDFGDGYTSSVPNPTHSYSNEGTYQVSLTATSQDNNIDVAYLTIDVVYTRLEISVVEYNTEEHIEILINHAFVLLYPTLDAWLNDYDAIVSGYTDNYGVITFAGLNEQQYYIWAEKVPAYYQDDGYDNYSFYVDELFSYIQTPVMVPCTLNTWIAWVDYFDYYQSPDKSIKKYRYKKYDKEKINNGKSSFILVDVSN